MPSKSVRQYYTVQYLDNINENKKDGIIIRSKARWVENGERNTKFSKFRKKEIEDESYESLY